MTVANFPEEVIIGGSRDKYEAEIEVLFPTRASAEKALDDILNVVKKYGFATVADFNDICGLESHYMVPSLKDSLWGWTDGSDLGFVVGRNTGCFALHLSPPILIKESDKKEDNVNHPSHYTSGKIEVIDFITDQKLTYCLGNAVKYVARAGKKDPNKTVEDLKKAVWYINKQIELLEEDDKRLGK